MVARCHVVDGGCREVQCNETFHFAYQLWLTSFCGDQTRATFNKNMLCMNMKISQKSNV